MAASTLHGVRITITGMLVLLVFGAACAGPGGPAGDPTPATTEPRWNTVHAGVSGAETTADPRSLLLTVRPLGGNASCYRSPRITEQTEEATHINATLTLEASRALVVGECPQPHEDTITLTAKEPIGDRMLLFAFDSTWKRAGDGYRKCHATMGCDTPADPCDPRWAHAARDGLDVPRRSSYDVELCDGQWLVLSVDANSTVCGAAPRPDCSAPANRQRHFLRWTGSDWQHVAAGRCPPDMPATVCGKLPPNS